MRLKTCPVTESLRIEKRLPTLSPTLCKLLSPTLTLVFLRGLIILRNLFRRVPCFFLASSTNIVFHLGTEMLFIMHIILQDAALSLRILIITARNRFHSHFFSVSQSFKAIAKGLWQLLGRVQRFFML